MVKKHSKLLLALILCVSLCFGLLAFNASATISPVSIDGTGLQYEIKDNTLTISVSGSGSKGIPSYDQNKTQKYAQNILQGFYETVVIEEGVISIGEYAFANMTQIKEVIIPASVTEIGKGAFFGCTKLATIFLRAGDSTTDNQLPNLTIINDGTFSGCSALKEITIPESVVEISQNAFSGCSALTDIKIPKSVKKIGADAFKDCNGLNSVTIDKDGIIEWCAIEFGNEFANPLACGHKLNGDETNIKSGVLTVPASVTDISDYAFVGCQSITEVKFLNDNTTIGKYAFKDCTALTAFDIPAKLVQIKDGTFMGCTNLATGGDTADVFTIPGTITSVGADAFNGCTNVVIKSIPAGLTALGARAFKGCQNLEINELKIPATITPKTVSEEVFYGCIKLGSITVPEGFVSVGDRAFGNCCNCNFCSCSSSRYRINTDRNNRIFKFYVCLCPRSYTVFNCKRYRAKYEFFIRFAFRSITALDRSI